MPAEQERLLARQMLRIGVDRHVVAPGRIGHGGGLGVDVAQQPLQEIDLSLPGSWRTPAWLVLHPDTQPYQPRGRSKVVRERGSPYRY